jgi:hypothetical protein
MPNVLVRFGLAVLPPRGLRAVVGPSFFTFTFKLPVDFDICISSSGTFDFEEDMIQGTVSLKLTQTQHYEFETEI